VGNAAVKVSLRVQQMAAVHTEYWWIKATNVSRKAFLTVDMQQTVAVQLLNSKNHLDHSKKPQSAKVMA
jgi:hypothetical protein